MRTEKEWAKKLGDVLNATEFSEFVVFIENLSDSDTSVEFSSALQGIDAEKNPHLYPYDDKGNRRVVESYVFENLLTTQIFPCCSRSEAEALGSKLLAGFYEKVDRVGDETKYINRRNKVVGKARQA